MNKILLLFLHKTCFPRLNQLFIIKPILNIDTGHGQTHDVITLVVTPITDVIKRLSG